MKICIVSPIYPTVSRPALGKFVHEQAKELVNQGLDVVVITIGDKKDKNYELIDKVKVYKIKKPSRLFFSIYFLILFLRLNKKYNFDLLHSHFVGPFTVICGIVAKLSGKPYVVTAHGIGLVQESFLKKVYLSFPARVVCVSRYVANLAKRYTRRNKVVFIPNGVDIDKLKPTKSVSQFKKELGVTNKQVLLSVCNLVERKGLDVIIKSLPNVIKKVPNIVYFIIGRGPEKEKLVNLVDNLKLTDKVVFIDYVTDKDLANYYAICDVFLLMSRTIKEKSGLEGFGVVYIEASFMGKPVIGGKSGGTADAVVNGKTGFLINPRNIKKLENMLILLLRNKKLRDEFGKKGRDRILKNFLWKHNVNKLINVYKEII